ncbi:MAG: bifunctional phosphopantothenoylcysteine decarboxylase/phosphopantothenate--cysteine ligase CoaBC [Clostridiales bacterium]|uniref:bifunctional phosphopantothenoylcysteine decarboxylase/phosphopantothenate--cysteine ligase CoaBC n=1 Tax=Provencibacterium massiliense TaxID=1841868 RepID=UPI0009A57190|nr:bifunctional phosphopantothenoylcysteine decarboxylase/phosphopantothenate--cysteine ligase CoaBC [Provencibacterium massiliense]PWM34787.1 MAG: bifunctional phosphopantothenoylcysteine decarboxylase/phosphopantothenate--cysteine ligase CoaBC [Clostridiales bacterium]RGB65924.1 bifunctional phosphopantothenoylcysteine decarboxylase/phosphopantothenate--cysteine ligase CoaBC [Harryflintia acetispora]
MCFRDKTIVLGVTGSIAAYKAAQLCSDLHKTGAQVHVIMTGSATKLVAPQTFETLSGNRVSVETFDRNFEWNVMHVSLAKKADVFVVAPATANFIAKMAQGLADDMLSSTILAAGCPKLVCPAMNTGMYENPATQENLRILRGRGISIVEPASGLLACGDEGRGRLADLPVIEEAISYALQTGKPLCGKRVLVSAGATREALDPVRFITNHSTGKMGYAIALAARAMGAQVTLVSANVALRDPYDVEVVPVVSAQEMYDAVMERLPEADIVVKTAAVADYRPAETAGEKIKKSDGALTLSLTRTRDILYEVCQKKAPGQLVCGFSMESENLLENSRQKLRRKGCDLLVANSLRTPGAGFGVDTNVAWLLTEGGEQELPLMSKRELAAVIMGKLAAMLEA